MKAAHRHTIALNIVHTEAARTLSRDDFDLCMRIARRALGYVPDECLPDIHRMRIADGAPGLPFPQVLTPSLHRVLGHMLWETRPIAAALRAAGRSIGARPEDEQAVVLHWLVGFVLEHGNDWSRHAAAALHELTNHRE